ncbi:hypothetical protein V2E24_00615, partial [Mycoplasmopsis ciconiae]|nr:hypothetical protein [Mycoplasmopsis ciconiae]
MKKVKKAPEIRFKGYENDWEQCTFEKLLNYERPDKYIIKGKILEKGLIPVLTANKGFILGYTNEDNYHDESECIIFDDFTLDNKLIDFKFMIKSSAIKLLTSASVYSIKFLYLLLNSVEFEYAGHARHYISVVQTTNTFVPSFNESHKIASILTNINSLITLDQRKLKSLTQIKTSLLDKMFVSEAESKPKIRFNNFTHAWEQ